MTRDRLILAVAVAVLLGIPVGFVLGWYWGGRDPLIVEGGRLQ